MRPIVEPAAIEPIASDFEVDIKPDIRTKSDEDDTAAVDAAIPLGTTGSSSPRTAPMSDLVDPVADTAKPVEEGSEIDTSSRPSSKRGTITARISDDDNETTTSSVCAVSPNHPGDDSVDPIDSIDRSPQKSAPTGSRGFKPRAFDKGKWNRSQSLSSGNPPPEPPVVPADLLREIAETAPQPLTSLTLSAYEKQNRQDVGTAEETKEAQSKQEEAKDTEAPVVVPPKGKKVKEPACILNSEE
jgi:hypothetical protein